MPDNTAAPSAMSVLVGDSISGKSLFSIHKDAAPIKIIMGMTI